MSLIGGCGVGAVYAAAGYMIDQNEAEKGHLMGLGASLALAAIMAKRYNKTRSAHTHTHTHARDKQMRYIAGRVSQRTLQRRSTTTTIRF